MITTIVNKTLGGSYEFTVKHSVYGVPVQKVQSKEILGKYIQGKGFEKKMVLTTAWLQENGKQCC